MKDVDPNLYRLGIMIEFASKILYAKILYDQMHGKYYNTKGYEDAFMRGDSSDKTKLYDACTIVGWIYHNVILFGFVIILFIINLCEMRKKG